MQRPMPLLPCLENTSLPNLEDLAPLVSVQSFCLCFCFCIFLMLPTFHPIRRRYLHPRFRAFSRAIFISLHDFLVILSTSSLCAEDTWVLSAQDSTENKDPRKPCACGGISPQSNVPHTGSFSSVVWDQPGTGCLCHFPSRGSQAQTFRPFLPVFLFLNAQSTYLIELCNWNKVPHIKITLNIFVVVWLGMAP